MAAILVAQGQPLEIEEVELPALGPGQVLVEIRATRICGSQIGEIDGVKGPDHHLPHLLGHEAGGIVLEAGPGVRHVKPGDAVVAHWRPGRGIDAGGSVYRRGQAPVHAGSITTFQRFSVVSENRLTPVPTGTDFEICALLADTLTTGFGIVNRDARVRIGESVVVIGCGGIGLGVVLGARLAGAHPIVGVDLYLHKLRQASAAGATHTLGPDAGDFAVAARSILGGPADVVVDATGNPSVLERAFDLTSGEGRCIGLGVMRHDQRLSINTLPLHLGRLLRGSHGGDSRPAEDIPRYLRMLRDGRFDVRGFVSHRLPLEQINDGIARMRSGEVVHAMVHFS